MKKQIQLITTAVIITMNDDTYKKCIIYPRIPPFLCKSLYDEGAERQHSDILTDQFSPGLLTLGTEFH